MIRVEGLVKNFTDGTHITRVLEDVSFTVPSGTSVAITGPSGSGKSTLLNILAGVIQPDQGEVELTRKDGTIMSLHDKGVAERTRLRRAHIGYVHQFFNLVPTLTVLENVLLPLELNKQSDALARAEHLLERCGMSHRLHAFPETLSGGEQQRVAVARALVLEPVVVLADEPTGNLDQGNSDAVAELLFAFAERSTLVVATHSQEIANRAESVLDLANL